MTVGEASPDIDLLLEDSVAGGGRVSFSGWRSMTVADAFRSGHTTWLVPLDRQGIFPLAFTAAGDAMKMTAPRTGRSFELTRVPEPETDSSHEG